MINVKFHRTIPQGENYDTCEPSVLLPDRVPTLHKIAEMFISGRPLDQSLQRNLSYNDIEFNPMLQKGLDLADIPEIAREVGKTLDEVNEIIQQQKVAKGTKEQVDNPASTEPTNVPTE